MGLGLDQPSHWVIVGILAVMLFGGYKRLPEMARSAGRSLRIFKTEMKGMADDDDARSATAPDAAGPASVVAPAAVVAVAPAAPVPAPAVTPAPVPAARVEAPVPNSDPSAPPAG